MKERQTKNRSRNQGQQRRNGRRAPFRWYGGKTRFLPKLLPLFPNHRRYVSVFGGSGGDIFGKPRSQIEVYNDLNDALHNFYATLRGDKSRRQLISLLEHTPLSRKQFASCLTSLQCGNTDGVERAWAFYYAAQCTYAGVDPCAATPGNFSVATENGVPKRWANVRQHLEMLARRFRSVVVECGRWQEVVRKYDDTDTFFYLDPPYLHSTRQAKGGYSCEMSTSDHIELLTGIQRLRGYVMLSGYPSDLYDEHLKGWRQRRFRVVCTASRKRTRPNRIEAVWMNYDANNVRLAV